MNRYDVIIVGAGPAGLNAALVLGRCRYSVLGFDSGEHRNAPSSAMHGFLSRDGTHPMELLRIGREQLAPYGVELRQALVATAECKDGGFALTTSAGETFYSRKLLLATGIIDVLPEFEGFAPLYGKSAFHCPYCDGYELRGQPLAVYGCEEKGYGLALELTGWSADVVLVSDGPCGIDANGLERLAKHGIPVREGKVARLEGTDGQLERIVFDNGETLERRALFFTTGQAQRSHLAETLGCPFNDKGTVRTGPYETTHLHGLYVAGDASRAVQWVIVAAAEGAEAAYSINQDLIKETLTGS